MHRHVGFTGTRHGMTIEQYSRLKSYFSSFFAKHESFSLHHGDCVGADAAMHEFVFRNFPNAHIIIHPPDIGRDRAFCHLKWKGEYTIYSTAPYLTRNQDIIRASDFLFAAPDTNTMQMRGGTWYTIRTAKKIGKEVHVIYPNGDIFRF